LPQGGVHFRVWAPAARAVSVVIAQKWSSAPAISELISEKSGYFSGVVPKAQAGWFYKFRLERSRKGQKTSTQDFPDPASRFQPQGPHGPSQIIDPTIFQWTDLSWNGVSRRDAVIYEMHIGTFTPEGTWNAAREQLPELASLGITVLEIMPVADFAGRFGWGYDGVNIFAPTRLYGAPSDFRTFVNRAHELGMAVILDVVYNHLGPDGNYLKHFSPDYFARRYKNDWGEALNFDGKNSGPVREFFTTNAASWIDEFHLDGFRFDATQQIFDASPEHLITAAGRAAREAANGRAVLIIGENEPQSTQFVRPIERGGYGCDALWNDDFHHSSRVALTGTSEAYYENYFGAPQEFISLIKYGYLYQGQWYASQKQNRGEPSFDLPPSHFVNFLENHDQIANSLQGKRVRQLANPGQWRAMTTLLLLSPQIPMLFQGQEFGASSPFVFFADHHPELAKLVAKGRRAYLNQFASIANPENAGFWDDPANEQSFRRCKLDLSERERHAADYQLHRDLLRLRREDPVFSQRVSVSIDGAVLGPKAFVLRFFSEEGQDRLLLVNLGSALNLERAPEPLLAPVAGSQWACLWSSNNSSYGGAGTGAFDLESHWQLPAHSALVLTPVADSTSKTILRAKSNQTLAESDRL
jgi:maltooligosyltrehalose trehalohydrolase